MFDTGKWISQIIVFLPLFTIGFNVYKIIVYRNRTKNFLKTKGVIIANDYTTASSSGPGRQKFYSPVVEFTTQANETLRLIYTEDNPDRPIYSIGDEVIIYYHPENPRRFLIHEPKAEYLSSGLWIFFGVLWLFFMIRGC